MAIDNELETLTRFETALFFFTTIAISSCNRYILLPVKARTYHVLHGSKRFRQEFYFSTVSFSLFLSFFLSSTFSRLFSQQALLTDILECFTILDLVTFRVSSFYIRVHHVS